MTLSSQAHQRQTTVDSRHDALRIDKSPLPQRVNLVGVLACLLVVLPGSQPATAAPPIQPIVQVLPGDQVGHNTIRAGLLTLQQQEPANWFNGLVELLAPCAPKGEAVADERTRKECEQRKPGLEVRWEKFKNDHGWAALLLSCAATLLAGIVVGFLFL